MGGLVGLRVVAELPDRFARVVVSNTGMVAREGFSGWLFENIVKLIVWWHGPITFEELKLARDKALENKLIDEIGTVKDAINYAAKLADINNDGALNVLDVVQLVNIILN